MIEIYLLVLFGLAAFLRGVAHLLIAYAVAGRIRRGASVENLLAGISLRVGFLDRQERENRK